MITPVIARRWIGVVAASLAVALLALLAWGMARPSGAFGGFGVNSQGSVARVEPRPAADIRLKLFDAKDTPWRLADQRSKTVVINFWASWCPPCRTEAGVLAQAGRDYSARGIVLVGVNVWDNKAAAQAFLDEFQIEYPNGRDDPGSVAADYGVTGLPETFVVDGDGRITARWIGPVTRAALDSMVTP